MYKKFSLVALIGLMLFDVVQAQTGWYKISAKYDADGLPLQVANNQSGRYYTFTNDFLYLSDEQGRRTEHDAIYKFDGQRDKDGNMHYVPYDKDAGTYNSRFGPAGAAMNPNAFMANQHRSLWGEIMVSPDRETIMIFDQSLSKSIGIYAEVYIKSTRSNSQKSLPSITNPRGNSSQNYGGQSQQNTSYAPQQSTTSYTQPSSNYMECAVCNGTGKCRTCAGRGEYRNPQTNTLYDCGVCRGGGKCSECYGRGKVRK